MFLLWFTISNRGVALRSMLKRVDASTLLFDFFLTCAKFINESRQWLIWDCNLIFKTYWSIKEYTNITLHLVCFEIKIYQIHIIKAIYKSLAPSIAKRAVFLFSNRLWTMTKYSSIRLFFILQEIILSI